MTSNFENIKADIKALYPEEDFTDAELNDMTTRLIKFFTIGAKAVHKAKRLEELKNLSIERKNQSTSNEEIG
ncbi:MAG: hypothetical protein ACK5N8_05885 [Alphaproteobacteria bacterium]